MHGHHDSTRRPRWQTVLDRGGGDFVYAATTMDVYRRPGCRSSNTGFRDGPLIGYWLGIPRKKALLEQERA
jgi:hypothetical protein